MTWKLWKQLVEILAELLITTSSWTSKVLKREEKIILYKQIDEEVTFARPLYESALILNFEATEVDRHSSSDFSAVRKFHEFQRLAPIVERLYASLIAKREASFTSIALENSFQDIGLYKAALITHHHHLFERQFTTWKQQNNKSYTDLKELVPYREKLLDSYLIHLDEFEFNYDLGMMISKKDVAEPMTSEGPTRTIA